MSQTSKRQICDYCYQFYDIEDDDYDQGEINVCPCCLNSDEDIGDESGYDEDYWWENEQ